LRFLEIVLSAANALTLGSLAIPWIRAVRGMGLLAVVATLVAVLHLLVEGPRWQMIPAYALSLVVLLTWLVGFTSADPIQVGPWIAGAGVGLGVLLLAISVALPVALPVFRFPKPTGPYSIGSVIYHWVDATRPELFTADSNDHRELMAQVWYPARNQPSKPRIPYMEDAGDLTAAMARIVHLPRYLFAHFKYVTTNAVRSAPVADGESVYPLLIFLSGTGGFRASNTFQIEELVSHGYVVVGLDQPGGSAAVRFPDGRLVSVLPRDQIQALVTQSTSPRPGAPALNGLTLQNGIIPYFAQDVSFAFDQLIALNANDPYGLLTGRLDPERVGIFGTSLGAIVAAEACRGDPRIRATLMMDAAMPLDVVRAGLRQPCMWISRPAGDMRLERSRSGGWPEEAIVETQTTMRSVFAMHAPGSAYYLDAPGMFHVNFTDAPLWSPITSLLGLTGPVDGRRMWNIVNAYSVAFFDKYLKGLPQALLDGRVKQYQEVSLERR
jgi:predicted dienelactone hydrolase